MFITKFNVQKSAATDNASALVELKKCILPLHLFTKQSEILILEKKSSCLA